MILSSCGHQGLPMPNHRASPPFVRLRRRCYSCRSRTWFCRASAHVTTYMSSRCLTLSRHRIRVHLTHHRMTDAVTAPHHARVSVSRRSVVVVVMPLANAAVPRFCVLHVSTCAVSFLAELTSRTAACICRRLNLSGVYYAICVRSVGFASHGPSLP